MVVFCLHSITNPSFGPVLEERKGIEQKKENKRQREREGGGKKKRGKERKSEKQKYKRKKVSGTNKRTNKCSGGHVKHPGIAFVQLPVTSIAKLTTVTDEKNEHVTSIWSRSLVSVKDVRMRILSGGERELLSGAGGMAAVRTQAGSSLTRLPPARKRFRLKGNFSGL